MTITSEIFEDIVNNLFITGDSSSKYTGYDQDVSHHISINYKFGYWPIVAQELQNEAKSKTLDGQRYPLIFLNADFEEQIIDYRKIRINPTFYILTMTHMNYTIQQRLDNVYKPILYQIYCDFMTAIHESKKFWIFEKEIPHTRKDLFYLQNLSAAQNQVNDIVDAVELKIPSLDMIKSVYDYYKSIG
jgi:hypothetical protein